MYLSEYLATHNTSYTDFAAECELNRITLYKALKGADIRLSTAAIIVNHTNDQVTYEDLVNERQDILVKKKNKTLKDARKQDSEKKKKKKTKKANDK